MWGIQPIYDIYKKRHYDSDSEDSSEAGNGNNNNNEEPPPPPPPPQEPWEDPDRFDPVLKNIPTQCLTMCRDHEVGVARNTYQYYVNNPGTNKNRFAVHNQMLRIINKGRFDKTLSQHRTANSVCSMLYNDLWSFEGPGEGVYLQIPFYVRGVNCTIDIKPELIIDYYMTANPKVDSFPTALELVIRPIDNNYQLLDQVKVTKYIPFGNIDENNPYHMRFHITLPSDHMRHPNYPPGKIVPYRFVMCWYHFRDTGVGTTVTSITPKYDKTYSPNPDIWNDAYSQYWPYSNSQFPATQSSLSYPNSCFMFDEVKTSMPAPYEWKLIFKEQYPDYGFLLTSNDGQSGTTLPFYPSPAPDNVMPSAPWRTIHNYWTWLAKTTFRSSEAGWDGQCKMASWRAFWYYYPKNDFPTWSQQCHYFVCDWYQYLYAHSGFGCSIILNQKYEIPGDVNYGFATFLSAGKKPLIDGVHRVSAAVMHSGNGVNPLPLTDFPTESIAFNSDALNEYCSWLNSDWSRQDHVDPQTVPDCHIYIPCSSQFMCILQKVS